MRVVSYIELYVELYADFQISGRYVQLFGLRYDVRKMQLIFDWDERGKRESEVELEDIAVRESVLCCCYIVRGACTSKFRTALCKLEEISSCFRKLITHVEQRRNLFVISE